MLECNLIKEHHPKYNVSYRDDKSYPYLAVCFDEDWPRVRYTRETHRRDRRYFGPYTNARVLREVLDTLLKIFPLRACSGTVYSRAKGTGRPCLYFHINRCPGPCVGRADPENYGRTLKQICAFLEGRQELVIADLTHEMEAASEQLEFERAAVFRDRIRTATQVLEKQRVDVDNRLNQDVFGLAVEDDIGCAQLLKIRAGKLVGSEDFIIEQAGGAAERELLTGFVKQYYDATAVLPDEILVPIALDEPEAIAAWLAEKKGRKVKLAVPGRGLKKRLAEMATENALHSLARHKLRIGHEAKTITAGLAELGEVLGLDGPPAIIECFDISNISGLHAVGSMVVFSGGKPQKAAYRRFKIRTGEGRPDDFKMMKEVISRRLRHGSGDPKFALPPNLMIVDGGRPQLKAALEAVAEAGVAGISVASLAKKDEEIYLPGRDRPIRLSRRSPGLQMLQRLRDEAHRFAVDYHRKLRGATVRGSELDKVVGIGPQRRQLLLRKFGSLKKIREAGEDALVSAGLPRDIAKRVIQDM